jgi:YHS domain-containing protein
MKNLKLVAGILLAVLLATLSSNVRADDTNSATATAPQPDNLKTCPVSGDKLGEMGKPYVFVYQGQEVKLCCPMCKADFDKDPQKYLKKIQDAKK